MITKSIKHLFIACLVSCNIVAALTSCEDMLESDSTRQVFDPELSQKTDSIYYALGIMQAMQQLADHYVFQGEMRGELVDTTHYTDVNLRQLADFSATTANRYDSAYVYYRVINNCNYYIAHRDTTLRTGATYVTRNEYAAVKAIRAWAYMQLARVYGRVPFYTEPLTQISQIDDNQYPELTLSEIVDRLAPDLEQYSGLPVPDFGNTFPNQSFFVPSKLFIPVDVVLGDMYLESGNYDMAAKHYVVYLTQVASANHTAFAENYRRSLFRMLSGVDDTDLPTDYDMEKNNRIASQRWGQTIFLTTTTGYNDVISYIPLAPKSSQGTTTRVPMAYGYDLYSTSRQQVDEIQLTPSQAYIDLSQNTDFYYISRFSTASQARSRVVSTSTSWATSISIATPPCCSTSLRPSTAWACTMLPSPSSRTASAAISSAATLPTSVRTRVCSCRPPIRSSRRPIWPSLRMPTPTSASTVMVQATSATTTVPPTSPTSRPTSSTRWWL